MAWLLLHWVSWCISLGQADGTIAEIRSAAGELERKRSEVGVLGALFFCSSVSLPACLMSFSPHSSFLPSPPPISLPLSLTTLYIFVQESRGPTKELEKAVDEHAKVRTDLTQP